MEGDCMKTSWECLDCNPLGTMRVIPDYESLQTALQERGIEYRDPPNPIQKPRQFRIPLELPNPGSSWTCGCQLIFTDSDEIELSVFVYLDQEAYLTKNGYNLEDVDEEVVIPDDAHEDSDRSMANAIINQYGGINESESSHNESVEDDFFPPNWKHATNFGYDTADQLAIDENAPSEFGSITSVSCFGDLHGYETTDEDTLSIVEMDYDSEYGSQSSLDPEVEQLARAQGLDLSRVFDIESEIDFDVEQKVFEVLDKSTARPTRSGRKKQSVKDAEEAELVRVVSNIMEKAAVRPNRPAVITQRGKIIEFVDLSDDEKEEVPAPNGKVKKRRRLRHKDADLINLDDLGLAEEKDNFVRVGDVIKTTSWFNPIDETDKELMNCLDLRDFRIYFRESVKRRIEDDSYVPLTTIEQLHEKIAFEEEELEGLKLQREALRVILEAQNQPTNPVERVLLNFRHPQKLYGLPFHMNQSLISNYQLALQLDEVYIPNEFTDNLPSKHYYLVQRCSKTDRLENLLEKITPQLPISPRIDVQESAHFVKRRLASRRYRDGRISQQENDLQMRLHPQPTIIEESRNGWDEPLPECSHRKRGYASVLPLTTTDPIEQPVIAQIYEENMPMEENVYQGVFMTPNEEYAYAAEPNFEARPQAMDENRTEAYSLAEDIAKATDLFDM